MQSSPSCNACRCGICGQFGHYSKSCPERDSSVALPARTPQPTQRLSALRASAAARPNLISKQGGQQAGNQLRADAIGQDAGPGVSRRDSPRSSARQQAVEEDDIAGPAQQVDAELMEAPSAQAAARAAARPAARAKHKASDRLVDTQLAQPDSSGTAVDSQLAQSDSDATAADAGSSKGIAHSAQQSSSRKDTSAGADGKNTNASPDIPSEQLTASQMASTAKQAGNGAQLDVVRAVDTEAGQDMDVATERSGDNGGRVPGNATDTSPETFSGTTEGLESSSGPELSPDEVWSSADRNSSAAVDVEWVADGTHRLTFHCTTLHVG